MNFAGADTSRTSRCPVFEALQFDNCVGLEAFLCLFRLTLAPPTMRLTTLTLTDVDWVRLAELTTLWRVVSPSLLDLTFNPWSLMFVKGLEHFAATDLLPVIDLSQFTRLTTLTLTFSREIPDVDDSVWVVASRILTRLVGHPSVRRVTLQITIRFPLQVDVRANESEGTNDRVQDAVLKLRAQQVEVVIVDGGSGDDYIAPGYLAILFPRILSSA
ncbi:hypothetical protein NM688_g7716 [Phlebia brevispora]|uniref:Uncharacterized protein n=1 Tax=Phlebia brevispora TaxID=194682 RepID=A0ACC1S282_9APHY|nr:hypothetical protein NM688_g7716 [Phlebia brevispora]